MNVIQITDEKLNELRMLSDSQLKDLGIDPDSVTIAVLEKDGLSDKYRALISKDESRHGSRKMNAAS